MAKIKDHVKTIGTKILGKYTSTKKLAVVLIRPYCSSDQTPNSETTNPNFHALFDKLVQVVFV